MVKPHPERVIRELVYMVLETGKEHTALFTQYILLHKKATGKLAPGCDAKDFYFVLDDVLEEISGIMEDDETCVT